MDIQEINQSSPEFLYQMLGRLEADCWGTVGALRAISGQATSASRSN